MMILPSLQLTRFTPMARTRACGSWLEWLGVAAGMAIVPLFPRSLYYVLGGSEGATVTPIAQQC